MKDNQKVNLAFQGTNGEIDPATGKPEVAPVFNQTFTVEPSDAPVTVIQSEDKNSADVIANDLPSGSAPVAFRVIGHSTSDAEGNNPLADCVYDDVVSNPPATAIAFAVGDVQPK